MSEIGGNGASDTTRPIELGPTLDERLFGARRATGELMDRVSVISVSFSRTDRGPAPMHPEDLNRQTLQRRETGQIALPQSESDEGDFPQVAHVASSSLASGGPITYEISVTALDPTTGETHGNPSIIGLPSGFDIQAPDASNQLAGYEAALVRVQGAVDVTSGNGVTAGHN